jgi:hypothetical protein
MATSYGFSAEIPLGKIRSFAQERAVEALEQVLGDGINDASMEKLTDEGGHLWLSVQCPEQDMAWTDTRRIDEALVNLAHFATEGFSVRACLNGVDETEFKGPTEAAAAEARMAWCLREAVNYLKLSGANLEALEQALDLVERLAGLTLWDEPGPDGEFFEPTVGLEDSHSVLMDLIAEARRIRAAARQPAKTGDVSSVCG